MPAPRKDRELFSHLGPRLEALIKFHELSHTAVANLLECKEPFIAHLCDGRRLLPAGKLPDLARFLEVTPKQLLGLDSINLEKTLYLPKL